MIKKLFITAILFFVGCESLFAQTDIFIRGSGKLFPIAIPQLCLQAGETTANKDISRLIARDLDLSGYFEVLDPGKYVESVTKCGAPENVAYSDWTIVGAEGLVRGTISFDGALLKAQLYLHDVQRQKIVLGKEYEGDPSQFSKMAHKFANEIMKAFTGEYGVFGTQIAFSSKVGRFKELYVMDMDGSNLRQLTNDKALSLSSAWNYAGNMLVFTSYRARQPDLFRIDLASKRVTPVTHTGNLSIGAKFFKDGQRLIVSTTTGNESDIVIMNLDGSIRKKLTPPNGVIDVSPSLSPDEAKVVFCSNRSGGPQIYTMNIDGSDVKRISFVSSNYCTSPAWSPKGDRIAYVCRADAGFNLFVSDPDGSNPMQLTSYGDNEDPDWSPDGRYLVYSSTFGKGYITSLAMMRYDGSSIRQLTSSRVGDSDPAWGPVLE